MLALAAGIAYANQGLFGDPIPWLDYVWFGLGIVGIIAVVRNLQKKTTVVLNSSGLKARALGNAIIKWGYIKSFEGGTGADGAVIIVRTRNREKLLKEMNTGVRPLMKANIKSYGEPVVIPASEVNAALEEAVEAMEAYRKTSK